MLTFRQFMEQQEMEEDKDIKKTLSKLPPHHRKLVDGYTFQFHAGNTLPGDRQHIGYMQEKPAVIAVAAPYNYGREFTLLHEIGHRVYDTLTPDLKKQWAEIVKDTKNKQKQSPVELFCMAYANCYAKHQIVIHDHPEWVKFIKELP